jgi:geranylgeranyl pyrophosphate synthase
LIDDVLDFTSNEETLGNAAGADLLGGKGDRCR